MKNKIICGTVLTSMLAIGGWYGWSQRSSDRPPQGNARADEPQQPGLDPDFPGPPGMGPDDFGPPGGPGGGLGGVRQNQELVKKFDKDGNGWLNAGERKAAREFLKTQSSNRRSGGPGGPRGMPGRRRDSEQSPQPGAKLTPTDVKSFPDAALYAPDVLRTVFLQFEDSDWEKELADFKYTDVEVPATLVVDGKTYPDVGVHFHGMSSYLMVGEGQKRSLVLTLDFIHPDQHLHGYRKLNLLNSHEDPSFLRTVLGMDVARDYLPAPKANFMRGVINGESWGLYVNQQHFNKDFVHDWFGTGKGLRWKVPGSPGGRGGLNYLGEDPAPYKKIYEIKSKDDPKSWAQLAGLCRILNQTPAADLERALAPVLDIDGALKFFAWENVLCNGDGFYTRASDYDLYADERGCFHIIPYDANETFSSGGGPGGPGGGPGGPGAMGGPGGPGNRRGPGGFGLGRFLAPQLLSQADTNNDGKVSELEWTGLAKTWYEKLAPASSSGVTREVFMAKFPELLPLPAGPGGGPRQGARGGNFRPGLDLAPAFFGAFDADKNGSLSRDEMAATFTKWFHDWDGEKSGGLDEESIGNGLTAFLPRPNFGGPGMPGGRAFGGPGGGGPGGGGVSLDPLIAANDSSKPVLSKLLAVSALRAKYLLYVRQITEKWLDWNKLGPLVKQYRELIAEDVKADTRKLDSFEQFERAVADTTTAAQPGKEGATGSLREFVEQRQKFLLNHEQVKKAAP